MTYQLKFQKFSQYRSGYCAQMSNFSTLIEIRQCFTSIDVCNDKEIVLKLVEYLVDHNHGSTIISGLFHQLYQKGENNSDEFLNGLLHCCQKITEKQNDKQRHEVNGTFDVLPDSLLCHIGSYLTTSEIFSEWDLVNRRFLQSGLKPEILTQWNFNNYDDDEINSLCKFSVAPLLKQIQVFHLHEDNHDLGQNIHIESMKSLKTLEYNRSGFAG